jgi:hypothetical protein
VSPVPIKSINELSILFIWRGMPPYTININAEVMSRSDVAAAKRNIQGLKESVELIQRQLLNVPANNANVGDIANQLLAASALRQAIQANETVILSALPQQKGGKLSDKERQEIDGYYKTGNYTQTALADQFGVAQSTIQAIVSSSEDTEGDD